MTSEVVRAELRRHFGGELLPGSSTNTQQCRELWPGGRQELARAVGVAQLHHQVQGIVCGACWFNSALPPSLWLDSFKFLFKKHLSCTEFQTITFQWSRWNHMIV